LVVPEAISGGQGVAPRAGATEGAGPESSAPRRSRAAAAPRREPPPGVRRERRRRARRRPCSWSPTARAEHEHTGKVRPVIVWRRPRRRL